MNIIRFTAAVLLILAVSGCANNSSLAKKPNPNPSMNDKYVHAINTSNRSRVSHVIWVNYPSDDEVAKRFGVEKDDSKDSNDSD